MRPGDSNATCPVISHCSVQAPTIVINAPSARLFFRYSHFVALLVVSLAVAACGSGPGVIERFEGGEVVEIHASADIEITAVSVVPLASVRPVPSSITAPRGGGAVFTAVAEDSEGRLLTGVRFEWSMRQQREVVLGFHNLRRARKRRLDVADVGAASATTSGRFGCTR